MRNVILSLAFLAVLAPDTAPAAGLNPFDSDPVLLNAPQALETLRLALRAENNTRDSAALTPAAAQPGGLGRFDPADLRVFGGEIGGDGVQGGAVLSLTWATAP